MHLLDDVHLLESEILAPPIVSTVSMFEHTLDRSRTWPASYELSDS